MKNKTKIFLTILGLLIATLSFAQSLEETCKNKMKELDLMVGSWQGGGWALDDNRARTEFTVDETIKYELNGTVLHVRGLGWDLNKKLTHNALAIISYDAAQEKYFMTSFLENGMQTKAELEIIEPGKINWWFNTGQGATIRYSITIQNGEWTEKGEYSPDGEIWYPIVEFTVKKQS